MDRLGFEPRTPTMPKSPIRASWIRFDQPALMFDKGRLKVARLHPSYPTRISEVYDGTSLDDRPFFP
jgi:hypothetical protein